MQDTLSTEYDNALISMPQETIFLHFKQKIQQQSQYVIERTIYFMESTK